jgi:hypothetical protein
VRRHAGLLLALTACAGPVEYSCTTTWDAGATVEPWGEGSMSCRLFRESGVQLIVAEESSCAADVGERDGQPATCRCVFTDRNGCDGATND